jgi:hypothetical protein
MRKKPRASIDRGDFVGYACLEFQLFPVLSLRLRWGIDTNKGSDAEEEVYAQEETVGDPASGSPGEVGQDRT